MEDTMRPEYDFSGGKRGVTARRYEEGAELVAVSPDDLDGLPDGVCRQRSAGGGADSETSPGGVTAGCRDALSRR